MIQFGTKIDIRDGKAYRTVLMPDGNWWLAEDVVYAGTTSPYLGFYTWQEAVEATVPGCHIPYSVDEGSTLEWSTLMDSIPGGSVSGGYSLKVVSGWTVPGVDDIGFSAENSGLYVRASYTDDWYFTSGASNNGTPFWGDWTGGTYAKCLKVQDDTNALILGDVLKEYTDGHGCNRRLRLRLIVDDGNIPDGLALTAQPSPGTFSTPQLVTIVSPEGAVVRYTTDGSIPTDSSPIYRGPIRLAAPTLIRAKIEGLDGITDLPFVIQGRPLDAYKQEALFTDGKTSPAFITRNQTL